PFPPPARGTPTANGCYRSGVLSIPVDASPATPRGSPAGDNARVSIALRAPIGWLGPGRVVEDVLVVTDGAAVEFAGPRRDYPGEYAVEDVVRVDGFLMPGVVDRHV